MRVRYDGPSPSFRRLFAARRFAGMLGRDDRDHAMRCKRLIRPDGVARLCLVCAGLCVMASRPVRLEARPLLQEQTAQAPIERRPPPQSSGARPSQSLNMPGRRGPRGEHLAEWMNQHSSLSPLDQQRALEQEPGFHELPTQTQQRMRERLSQLDAMTPQRRQRMLARTEAMERLNPDQRAEVRGAMSQLGTLPPEERRAVAHTFRELRELPLEQRAGAYASGRYGPMLSDTDRSVLMNLLRVEPMLPPPAPKNATGPGLR